MDEVLEFTIEPSDVTVQEGQSVLLPCEGKTNANKGLNPSQPWIRWRGPDGQDLGIVGDTFRAKLPNGSLYISSVEANRGLTGSYQCLITVDGIGTIISRPAVVSIDVLPEINQDFVEIYVLPNQTAFFRCLTGHIPKSLKFQVNWLKDDRPLIVDKMRMVILPNGGLEIDDVNPNDRGSYQCNITTGNSYKLSSKTNLNLKKAVVGESEKFIAPTFLVGPQPQTVREGDTLTLECVANGMPKPQIEWLSMEKKSILNSRFIRLGTGSLQIQPAEDSDSGNYQCRASNAVDSLDAQATVQVHVPPRFIKSPSDKTAFEKDELEFECAIVGHPKPTIKWLKNGDVINPNDYMHLVGGHNLRILGLLRSDAGMFQCIGVNSVGSIQEAAHLKVIQYNKSKKLPSKLLPKKFKNFSSSSMRTKALDNTRQIQKSFLDSLKSNLIAQNVKGTLVTVSWDEPEKFKQKALYDIHSYSVFYKPLDSEREQQIRTKTDQEMQINVPFLRPGKTYEIRVVANTEFGPSESSEIIRVTTSNQGITVGAPRDLVGYVQSHKDILLKWEPSSGVSKYRIYYNEDDSMPTLYTDSNRADVLLTDLRPNAEYTIYVVPITPNGEGDPSREIKLKTFSTVPSEPPSNIKLEPTSSTSITIHWEPPSREPQMAKLRDTKSGNIQHYELDNLSKASEYQIKIAALTVNGTGPFSEWMKAETFAMDLDESQVPGKPNWVSVRPENGRIYLQWTPPEQKEIKVRNYVIGWGIGIPDEHTFVLPEYNHNYELKNLEPNTDYVISLRARNIKGEGQPIYDNVKSKGEEALEPLNVPVGVSTTTMSSTSIVVIWIDTDPTKARYLDNRLYMVRYNQLGSTRFKYHNASDTNAMITELKPSTTYEFAVKVVRGRQESDWSMSATNTTFPNVQISPPRDLQIHQNDTMNSLNQVFLTWTPPPKGQIIGYNVFYTNDATKRDKDWQIETITMPRAVGLGPFSTLLPFTTGSGVISTEQSVNSVKEEAPYSGPNDAFNDKINLIIIISGSLAGVLILTFVALFFMCGKKEPPTTPEHLKKNSYEKNPSVPKPPDLWIHHDQMELKGIDTLPQSDGPEVMTVCSSSDQTSLVGTMTLPRPGPTMVHEHYETAMPPNISNSLDNRSYGPGYLIGSVNSTIDRSQYARAQYSIPNKNHIQQRDNALSQQSLTHSHNNSLMQTPEHPYGSYNPSMPYNVAVAADIRGQQLMSFGMAGNSTASTPIITCPTKVTLRPHNNLHIRNHHLVPRIA
uniref:Neogenin n=1 Tax=Megaselia scalaris TaxID=36166 RepID=T1GGQ4_MEGSC